jgi:hypothetical protein
MHVVRAYVVVTTLKLVKQHPLLDSVNARLEGTFRKDYSLAKASQHWQGLSATLLTGVKP